MTISNQLILNSQPCSDFGFVVLIFTVDSKEEKSSITGQIPGNSAVAELRTRTQHAEYTLAASSSWNSKTLVEAIHTLWGGFQLMSEVFWACTGRTDLPPFTWGFANYITTYLCCPCVWEYVTGLKGASWKKDNYYLVDILVVSSSSVGE